MLHFLSRFFQICRENARFGPVRSGIPALRVVVRGRSRGWGRTRGPGRDLLPPPGEDSGSGRVPAPPRERTRMPPENPAPPRERTRAPAWDSASLQERTQVSAGTRPVPGRGLESPPLPPLLPTLEGVDHADERSVGRLKRADERVEPPEVCLNWAASDTESSGGSSKRSHSSTRPLEESSNSASCSMTPSVRLGDRH